MPNLLLKAGLTSKPAQGQVQLSFEKPALVEISRPSWAKHSCALPIQCEFPFPGHAAGISVVKIQICRFLPFLQEESASVFPTIPYAQLKTAIWFLFGVQFCRLNKPGLVSSLQVLVVHSSACSVWGPCGWHPALHTGCFPRKCHLQHGTSHCVHHAGRGSRFQLYQPILRFEKCHLLADSLLLLSSCEFSAHTGERSLLTLCSSLQSVSLQFDCTGPVKSVSKPC